MASTRKKRVALAPPRLLAPVRAKLVDPATGKPRMNTMGRAGQMEVWVCPYCFNWRSARKHIADCCAQHHNRLVDLWGKLVEQGVVEAPEPPYRGHLPIINFEGDVGHFVGGSDGRYRLELPDGSRFNSAEARLAGRRGSEHPSATLLRRALAVWPKGGRGRKE